MLQGHRPALKTLIAMRSGAPVQAVVEGFSYVLSTMGVDPRFRDDKDVLSADPTVPDSLTNLGFRSANVSPHSFPLLFVLSTCSNQHSADCDPQTFPVVLSEKHETVSLRRHVEKHAAEELQRRHEPVKGCSVDETVPVLQRQLHDWFHFSVP